MVKRILLATTAFVMTLSIAQAQNLSFSDNIVSLWKLDETSGTTFTDDISGATGEVMGEASTWSWGEGIKGGALDFSTVDTSNVGQIEDSEALAPINETLADTENGSFSVSIWVKCSQDALDGLLGNAEQVFVIKGDNGTHGPNGNGNRFVLSSKEGKIYWAVDDDVTKSQLSIQPEEFEWKSGEWNHLVGVRDLENFLMKFYLNGVFINEVEDATLEPIDIANQRMLIGNYHNHTNPTHGSIDEVMFITKGLSEAEVTELYSSYQTSGIFNNRVTENIKVTPNPVASDLIISNASKLTKVEVYSLNGAVVKTITNSQNATIRTNVDDLPTGKYIVKAIDVNNVISTGSFIKQ